MDEYNNGSPTPLHDVDPVPFTGCAQVEAAASPWYPLAERAIITHLIEDRRVLAPPHGALMLQASTPMEQCTRQAGGYVYRGWVDYGIHQACKPLAT